jgi:transcriptional regulator with XRE-family HTH domain
MIYFNWTVLADWRKESNLTQQQLADQAGVSKSTIEKIEAGAAPSTVKLGLLAQALEMPASQLLEDAEECGDRIEEALSKYGQGSSPERERSWEVGIVDFIGLNEDDLVEGRNELRRSMRLLASELTCLEIDREDDEEILVPSWGGAYKWVEENRAEILSLLDDAIGEEDEEG